MERRWSWLAAIAAGLDTVTFSWFACNRSFTKTSRCCIVRPSTEHSNRIMAGVGLGLTLLSLAVWVGLLSLRGSLADQRLDVQETESCGPQFML